MEKAPRCGNSSRYSREIFMSESVEANSEKAMTGLFKYFPPDKLDFFENRLVLLTPPKFLNDAWDFLPKGRTATYEETFREHQKIEKEIAKSSAHIPAWFVQLQPKKRLQRMLDAGKSREFVEGLPKYSQERVSSTYGIVSLTETPSCRLMWAHYAESHSGFVAEFIASDHFVEPNEKLPSCSCIGFPACKVQYPPSFKPLPWTANSIVGASWAKYPFWKYEQEWRMLLPLEESVHCCIVKKEKSGSERYCLPFLPENLTRVIFGMRMKRNNGCASCLIQMNSSTSRNR
jgi:hypothetical protein